MVFMNKLLRKTGQAMAASLWCLALAVGCTDYSSKIDEVEKRLEAVENNQIASVGQQADAIGNTIPKLEKADADLKGMIESLRKTADGLRESIKANEGSISDLKSDLEKAVEALKNSDTADKEALLESLSKEKATLISTLEAAKTELEGKLGDVENTLKDLEKKDSDLEKKISDLKTYADKELKDAKDWMTVTFMTLKQYDSIVVKIGGLNKKIAGLKTSLTDLETRLTEKYPKDLTDASDRIKSKLGDVVTELNERLDNEVKAITESYTAAIAKARDAIEEAWKASLKKSIDDCEASMKQWVNETLTGYWTIEEVKAELEAQMTDIQGQLEAKKTFLNGLINANVGDLKTLNDKLTELDGAVAQNAADLKTFENDLAQAKIDLTNAYTAAINDAVTKFEGSFPDEIKTRISSVNSELDKKKADIEGEVTSLETSVDELEAKLSEFLNASQAAKIQSVSWFPTSTDGKETLYYDKGDKDFPGSENYRYIKFRFEVRPATEAANITAELLSARLLYTKTRAATGDVEELDITDFSNASGVITVTIDASKIDKAFIDGKIPASVAVAVGDLSTKYVPLKAQALEDPVIRYETIDGKMLPDSEIAGVRGYSKEGGILNRKHTYGRIDFTGAEIGELLLNLSRKSWDEDKNATLRRIKVCRNVAVGESGIYRELSFCNQYKLESADLEKLDVSKVDNFMNMFAWCTRLSDLKISSWNPKPKEMYQAFYCCSNLETLDLSGWNMSQIDRVSEMLCNCTSLKKVYMDNWDLANYTGGRLPKVYEWWVFTGINCRKRDFYIYVRNCNDKTVKAVRRWVDNSQIAGGEPLNKGRCKIITK